MAGAHDQGDGRGDGDHVHLHQEAALLGHVQAAQAARDHRAQGLHGGRLPIVMRHVIMAT
eukprot:2483438-Prymnesium_polylepis.3